MKLNAEKTTAKNLAIGIAVLMLLGGCDQSEKEHYAASPSEVRGCLPLFPSELVDYDSEELQLADFCTPQDEVVKEVAIGDRQSWAISKPARRIAFVPRVQHPEKTAVIVITDKNTYPFTLTW